MSTPLLRPLGRADYQPTLDAMRAFTETRDADTPDEIWLCEHPPVYTQGLSGKAEHVLDAHGIPVVQTNRGGCSQSQISSGVSASRVSVKVRIASSVG